MSVDASLKLICQNKGESVNEIIQMFNNIGWTLFDKDGKITYLPLNDNDEFDWKREEISKNALFEIISEKEKNQELVGLVLYWDKTDAGISILFQSRNDILISLNINRKTMSSGDLRSTTDVNWYIENIIVSLRKFGCIIENYIFEEY